MRHDPIWYFSCLCRKFSELRALLFLISTPNSQNLKFIQKCSCLSSSKNKFQWTQKKFWHLIRKVLIWTFWDYKSSLSKKSTPIQPRGVIGAPPTMYFQKMQFLGVFRPFLQRSLPKCPWVASWWLIPSTKSLGLSQISWKIKE